LPLTTSPLHLAAPFFRELLATQGPSLGLWRAAEVAALREQIYARPVLDLGCGDGLITSMVLSTVEIGIDPDANVLKRAAATGTYVQLQPVTAEQAEIPEGTIATVVSNSVLEHLPDLCSVIDAVSRMLRPGGRFIFTTPTREFGMWLALPYRRYACWRNQHLLHLNLLTAEQWAERLGQSGFTVERVRPYLKRPLVFTWDLCDLLEQIWVARTRLVGLVWRRLPSPLLDRLAVAGSKLNLSAPYPGGGQVIVARKRTMSGPLPFLSEGQFRIQHSKFNIRSS
jgi:SAM-dependent methyltransferase